MSKLLAGIKIFLLVLILVFLITYIASAVFVAYYGKKGIIKLVSNEVSKKTSLNIKIADINFSFFPFVAVNIRDTELEQKYKYRAFVKKVSVYINVLELFKAKSPLCIDIVDSDFLLYKSLNNKSKIKNSTGIEHSKPGDTELFSALKQIPLLSAVNLRLKNFYFHINKDKALESTFDASGSFNFIKYVLALSIDAKNKLSNKDIFMKGTSFLDFWARLNSKNTVNFNVKLDLTKSIINLDSIIKPKGVDTTIALDGLYNLKSGSFDTKLNIILAKNKLKAEISGASVKQKITLKASKLSLAGLQVKNNVLRKLTMQDFIVNLRHDVPKDRTDIDSLSFKFSGAEFNLKGYLLKQNAYFNYNLTKVSFREFSKIVLKEEYANVFTGIFKTAGNFKLKGKHYIITGALNIKDFGYSALKINILANKLTTSKKLPIKLNIKQDGVWRVLKAKYIIEKDSYKFLDIYGTDNSINLDGKADVVNNNLEAHLGLYFPKNMIGNAEFLDKQGKRYFPIRLHKNPASPSLDINYTVEYVLKRFIEYKKQKIRKEINKKLDKAKLEAKQRVQRELDKKKEKANKLIQKEKDKLKSKVKSLLHW